MKWGDLGLRCTQETAGRRGSQTGPASPCWVNAVKRKGHSEHLPRPHGKGTPRRCSAWKPWDDDDENACLVGKPWGLSKSHGE